VLRLVHTGTRPGRMKTLGGRSWDHGSLLQVAELTIAPVGELL
jgi:hypothetical protein